MAYRNYFRSVLNDNFKILTWVLILFIAITPNFIFMRSANAANVGGWNLSNAVVQGASTVYDATKNVIINGKNFIKQSSVKITPTASQVSKVLARGAAGYALSVAVEQLLGAVDWVLDPANNQVVYYKEPSKSKNCQTDSCKGKYIWYIDTTLTNGNRVYYSAPSESVAISLYGSYMTSGGYYVKADIKIISKRVSDAKIEYDHSSVLTNKYGDRINVSGTLTFYRVLNPNFDPKAEERERKTIPLETVAQKVISNAESGDTNAKVATTAAAADIVAEAETDNSKARPIVSQAEANATTKPADAADAEKANDATGTSQPNTANPEATDIALEFPVFCNWAPTVCEAAQTVIVFPQTLTNWWDTANEKANEWATSISEAWTYAKNWATENHTDAESTKVTVEQDNNIIFDDSQRITFGNSCPSPQQFSVSFSGTTQNLEFSYQPLCQFMSMIKPFVVAGSYLIGAYIVMGLSRGSAE